MISKKLLLYYCFLFALFITISGIAVSQSPSQLLLQAFFLPVTAYLGLMVFKDFKVKTHQEESEKKIEAKRRFRVTKTYVFVLGFFFILLATSMIRILQDTRSKTTTTKPQQSVGGVSSVLTITPIPLSALKSKEATSTAYVIINPDDKRSFVNIRLSPSTSAKVVKKAKSEEQYPLAADEEKWYKIVLENGSFGYVSKEVATISQTQEKKNK